VGSEPPPTIPYPYGIGSSSTLTIGQQSLFAALPGTAASHPYLLRHVASTASRLTAQIPSQRSNHAIDTLYTEHQELPSDADHRRSGDQQGGRVSRKPSRRSTGGSEPASPMPIDPEPFDFNTLKNGLAQHQVYGSPSGAGKSRTNSQSNLGASRMLLVLIFPYSAPDTCGGSVLNIGDGHYQGGQSRNASRAFFCFILFRVLMTSRVGARLPNNPSRDHLAQYSKSSAFFSRNPLGRKE
jgi:hypothetical protein